MVAPLTPIEPMGIYRALAAFQEATGKRLGDTGTHPWSQGFPLLEGLPGAPALPQSLHVAPEMLRYPAAPGEEALRLRIAEHYGRWYGAKLTPDNIQIFPGGRAALAAVLGLLHPEYNIALEETEYPLYHSLISLLKRERVLIESSPENRFSPSAKDYERGLGSLENLLVLKSNPCNPTGRVVAGSELGSLVKRCLNHTRALLVDEAYEFFHSPRPVSALEFVPQIEGSRLFVVGAATKGLRAPGARIGWVVASSEQIKILRSFGSMLHGGVSRLSQEYVTKLLDPALATASYQAVSKHYDVQRERYHTAFEKMGFGVYTGTSGFYHWLKLPGGLHADTLNRALAAEYAAILPGELFDMRPTPRGPRLESFLRFSFGPLSPQSFESDIALWERALDRACKLKVAA